MNFGKLKAIAGKAIEEARVLVAPYELWKVLLVTGAVLLGIGFLSGWAVLSFPGILVVLLGFGLATVEAMKAVEEAEAEDESAGKEVGDGSEKSTEV